MAILNPPADAQAGFHRVVEPLFHKMLTTQRQQHMTEDFKVLLNARMAVAR